VPLINASPSLAQSRTGFIPNFFKADFAEIIFVEKTFSSVTFFTI